MKNAVQSEPASIPLEVTRIEMDQLAHFRDWALKLGESFKDKDAILHVLAVRLGIDASCLGERLICRGFVHQGTQKYSLAVSKKKTKKKATR